MARAGVGRVKAVRDQAMRGTRAPGEGAIAAAWRVLGKWRALALLATVAVAAGWLAPGAALAGTGQPSPWQINFQGAASPIAENMLSFHNFVLVISTAIMLFVLVLMAIVILRYNERANPTPSKTTHNTALEITWTVIPIIILVVIAVPSFKLLYDQYSFPKPDLTIKAIGHQWYWTHEYPDYGDISIDSVMLDDEERAELIKQGIDAPRMLAVDNEIVVPVNKVVHVLVTADDVIHAWTIPSFGSKVDAVPGRITSTWFKATKKGIFYGQCSELCGRDHARMPIAIRVVDQDVFDRWIAAMKADDEDKAKEIIRAAIEREKKTRRLAEAQQS